MRNAEIRSGTERSPRARQAGPAAHATVQADVQQGPVPAGLREHLLQPGSDDARNRRGDGRRHVRGKDRGDRGTDAPRARLLLEAYYEPGFSDRSHGFRKGRGCHTALREIRETWSGTT